MDLNTSAARPASGLLSWLAWHICFVFAVGAVSSQLFYGGMLPKIALAKLPFLVSFAAFYIAATLCFLALTWRGRRASIVELLLLGGSAIGAWALYLLMAKVEIVRPLVVAWVALGLGSMLTSLMVPARRLFAVGVLLLLLAVGLQFLGERPRELIITALDMGPKPTRSQGVVSTSMYSIQATFYDNYFNVCAEGGAACDTPRTGGALELFREGFLFATGEGYLHFIDDRPQQRLEARQLATRVPINSDAFLAGGANYRDLGVFRVMDILVREMGEDFELFAAHHFWDAPRGCFVMRVSRLKGDARRFLSEDLSGEWQTVWDAEPCLPLKMANGGQKQFGGDGAGGRMLMMDDNTLLVTIGDQQWDGWNWDHAVSQDMASAYGKIIKIDLPTGKGSVFSSGLRNPEGFFRDQQGQLWSTEHGPQGGDELNVIVEGGNYGWPRMTYGTEYGTQDWPLREPGADDDPALRRPIYSWVPSIGVSCGMSVRGALFERWRGDFLICSFKQSLFRAHVKENRVIVLEPVLVRERNGRIRDIVETPDGRIVLLLDLGAIAFLEPLDSTATDSRTIAARGAMLFNACAQCHKVGDGTQHAVGPDLRGVVSRDIGGARGFSYSDALSSAQGRWTESRLDAFLRDPQGEMPGTAMQIRGISDPADRVALIAHLRSLP